MGEMPLQQPGASQVCVEDVLSHNVLRVDAVEGGEPPAPQRIIYAFDRSVAACWMSFMACCSSFSAFAVLLPAPFDALVAGVAFVFLAFFIGFFAIAVGSKMVLETASPMAAKSVAKIPRRFFTTLLTAWQCRTCM